VNTRLALVVTVVLLAGCSSLGQPDRSSTVTPAPVPEQAQTTTPDPLPPGVTGGGIDDLNELSRGHVEVTTGTAYTWESRYQSVRYLDNGTLESDRRQRARVENETHYVYWTNRREADDDEPFSFLGNYTEYATPGQQYTTFEDSGRMAYQTVPERPARAVIGDRTRSAIGEYLAVENATVAVTRLDGQRFYEITGTEYALPTAWELQNYSVQAVVSPDGFVRSLDVEYVRTNGDERERISYSFSYTAVGETTVDRPDWVDEQWPDEG